MATAEQIVTSVAVRHLQILDRPFQDLTKGDPYSHLWSSLPVALEEELGVEFGSDAIGPGTTLRELIALAERGKR